MKDYKRLTDRVTAEMLRNTEGESWDSDNIEAQCYIRLADLEDKIESGELVDRNEYLARLMTPKNASELTDKEIEFFVKHNARVREDTDKEFASLTAENAELRERLKKAVELPYIEKRKEYTKIVYRNEFGDIDDETYFHDCYYSYKNDIRGDKYAEARLAELKGGKE